MWSAWAEKAQKGVLTAQVAQDGLIKYLRRLARISDDT